MSDKVNEQEDKNKSTHYTGYDYYKDDWTNKERAAMQDYKAGSGSSESPYGVDINKTKHQADSGAGTFQKAELPGTGKKGDWGEVYKDSKPRLIDAGGAFFNQVHFRQPVKSVLAKQREYLKQYPNGGIFVTRPGSTNTADLVKQKPDANGYFFPFSKYYVNPETKQPYTDDEIENFKGRWEGGLFDSKTEKMHWLPLTSEQIQKLKNDKVITPVITKGDLEKRRIEADAFIVLGHPSVVDNLAKAVGGDSITSEINQDAPTEPVINDNIVSDLAWVHSEIVLPPGFRGRNAGATQQERTGYKDAALVAGWLDILSHNSGEFAVTRFKRIMKIASHQKVDMIVVTINDSDKFDATQKANLKSLNSAIKTYGYSGGKYNIVDWAKFLDSTKDKESYLQSEGVGAGVIPNAKGMTWIKNQLLRYEREMNAKMSDAGDVKGEETEKSDFSQADLKEVFGGTSDIDQDGEMKALIIQKAQQAHKDGLEKFTIKDPRNESIITFKVTLNDSTGKLNIAVV